MKNFFFKILLLLLAFSTTAIGQKQLAHSLFLEAGGNAYWYSVNYEYQTTNGFTFRVGTGYLYKALVIPMMAGKVFGHKTHHLELSLGIDLAHNADNNFAYTSFVGYRYQPPSKDIFIRAGFTPILTTSGIPEWYPWAGAAFGYRF